MLSITFVAVLCSFIEKYDAKDEFVYFCPPFATAKTNNTSVLQTFECNLDGGSYSGRDNRGV